MNFPAILTFTQYNQNLTLKLTPSTAQKQQFPENKIKEHPHFLNAKTLPFPIQRLQTFEQLTVSLQ